MTEQDVTAILKNAIDPNTGRDFVTGKAVRKITVTGSDVAVDLGLGYPAKSQHESLRKLVASALASMPGVGRVSVTVGTRIVSHAVQRGVKLLLEPCGVTLRALHIGTKLLEGPHLLRVIEVRAAVARKGQHANLFSPDGYAQPPMGITAPSMGALSQ